MQKDEKFFIFSRKEISVICLLVLIIIGFFFTLGLHYGKKLNPAAESTASAEANHDEHAKHAEKKGGTLEESPEHLPAKETLDDAAEHSAATTKDTIESATHEELGQTGVKVDHPRPVDLPTEKTVGKGAHKDATHEKHTQEKPKDSAKDHAKEPAKEQSSAYAIQLGSYPSKKDAQAKIKGLSKLGLHPEIRNATVKGQVHYRVVLSGFKSKPTADQKAKELKAKNKIENFVVIKTE